MLSESYKIKEMSVIGFIETSVIVKFHTYVFDEKSPSIWKNFNDLFCSDFPSPLTETALQLVNLVISFFLKEQCRTCASCAILAI